MPKFKNPISIIQPETPYTGAEYTLSIVGKPDKSILSLVLGPYRVLDDGTVDRAPKANNIVYSSADALNDTDPKVRKLARDVEKLVETFLQEG